MQMLGPPEDTLNFHLRQLLFSISLFLALITPAVARDQALPEQVNQWTQDCVEGYQQGHYRQALLSCQSVVDALQILHAEHPTFATALNNLAALYKAQGNYAEAEPLYRRSLRILEKALGPKHPDVANILNNLGELHKDQGNYAQAEPLYQRSLRIWETALGLEHPSVAHSLNNLAALYAAQGDYAQAEPLFLRSLRMREKMLGPEHPDVALSLNNLAEFYRLKGSYRRAEPLYRRSLRILEKALGLEHPDVALSLNNLAGLYHVQGNYAQAEQLLQRSLRIAEKALGPEHPHVALSLNNLAENYAAQRKHAQAEPLAQRSLRIKEKALGPEHSEVAVGLNTLAGLYSAQGKYAQAEPLYLRSLQILEKELGANHPTVAKSLSNLSGLYSNQGKYAQAERLGLRSLRIKEKVLGPEHPDVAESLNNMAALYDAQGNYAQAEPLYQRSLQVWEKALGPEHPSVATSLQNLAAFYNNQGKPALAEPLALRSLQINEKALGSQHPNLANSLNNLAMIYQFQGMYVLAKPLHLRSLQIREEALGPEHPDVAQSLHNLAMLHNSQGDHAQAEQLYLRSLKIWEKALGPEHPIVAQSITSLAEFDLEQGHVTQALSRFARGLGIHEKSLRETTTEARVTALLDDMRSEEDAVYSLLLLRDASVKVWTFVLSMSLLRKGRAAEAGLMTGWALRSSLTSDDQRARFASWQALRSQHEALFLRGPAKPNDAFRQTYQARLAELRNQIDNQEHELAGAAPQILQWKLPPPEQMLAQVAAQLHKGSALVEVLWVKPFLFPSMGTGVTEPRIGQPQYFALILFPDQRVEFVNLGDAEQIDHAVGELLTGVRDQSQEPLRQAQALYKKVMAPLLPKLGGAKQLYLSLDGSLNLVPFAALHDGQRYLIDSPYQILYLSSGRDLLRRSLGQPQQPALVLAAPDFGSKIAATALAEKRSVADDTRGLYEGLASLQPLKGARAEGLFVANLLGVVPRLGGAATEALLRQARAPRLLHIATHGLFLSDAIIGSRGTRAKLVGAMPSDTFHGLTGRTGYRSLSLSGLVLAGAAHAATAVDAANDGLLTAEEARSLYLFGTQLVVLSACDTGRGAVKAGQGVYGLRRVFLVAGAETVVMSLWPVSDSGSQGLMKEYYQRLLDPGNRSGRIGGLVEAMRAVKVEHPHPYFWAPFIATGVDAPLKSK